MRKEHLLLFVACLILSLNVYAQNVGVTDDKVTRSNKYVRVTDLSQLEEGSTIVFASRHDADETSYYAMPNEVSGKPSGVIFTSEILDEGQCLPLDIVDNELDYCWTLGVSGGVYTFTNSEGDLIGYGSSGTDFVRNGENSTWFIVPAVSGEGTIAPGHNAFTITNEGVSNRSFAFRKYNNSAVYEKFAPYSNSESNMNGSIYYFFIDIFMKNEDNIEVVSNPIFSPGAGVYQNTQFVSIECDTEQAIVYYTLDGSDPDNTSEIYTTPIEVSNSMIIKAIAMKDGMMDSDVVESEYIIAEPLTVTFYNNGQLMDTYTVAQGSEIGELPTAIPPDGYSFKGWTENNIATYTDTSPVMITSATVVESDIDLYAVFAIDYNKWIETDVTSLVSTDNVVIAISKDNNYYAMSQVLGGNGQPTVMDIIIDNGVIISDIHDSLQWNIVYSDANMVIYPKNVSEDWLYCLSGSNNNSVRIGDNTDNRIFELKTVEINDVIYSDYLYNTMTQRFVGVYFDNDIAVDWRAYKLTASGAFPSNIRNQTYHFYKYLDSKYYCTSIDIPEAQTITHDVTWGNVSIMNTIVIEENTTLTIEGAIASIDSDNIIIKDGGQLIHNNQGVSATYEKEIDGYGNSGGDMVTGWFTIGSPMKGSVLLSDINNLIPEDNNYDLYRYDEPTSQWQNVKDNTNYFTTFDVGRGYLYANEYDATLSFVGELNSEAQTYHLTKTDGIDLSGFHLISNPFSHVIYKGVNAAIDDSDLALGYYVITGEGAWQPMTYEDAILPGQGILIKTSLSKDLVIAKNINEAEGESSLTRKIDKGMIMISVKNKDYEDIAYITNNEGYGLDKIPHHNDEVHMIYVSLEDGDYAIASIDANMLHIPLSFRAMNMGEYTITVSIKDIEYDKLYLLDRHTGEVTNMLLDSYSFVAKSNDNPERFILSLDEISSITDDDSCYEDYFGYIDDNELIIKGIIDETVISIYDIMGRCLYYTSVDMHHCDNRSEVRLPWHHSQTGVYLIHKIDSNGIKTQKIIID